MGILASLSGLIVLLVGLKMLEDGLNGLAGPRLAQFINRFTATPLQGFLSATLVTALVQSSSAVTVITIGLVDTGVLGFAAAVGLILGANLGTTVTAQIMALNLGYLAVPALATGLGLILFHRRPTWRHGGAALGGLGLIFASLAVVEQATSSLAALPAVSNLLLRSAQQPLFGVVLGTLITAALQSSSAVTGVLVALGNQGHLTLTAAVPIILGSNVGTCVTAVLTAARAGHEARKVAATHVLVNLLGILAFFPFLGPFASLVAASAAALPGQVANAHLFFNLFSSLALLPLARPLAATVSFFMGDRRSRW